MGEMEESVQHHEVKDPIWDFLDDDARNSVTSNGFPMSLDYMDLENFPLREDGNYSPTFHELFDHNQFFTDQPDRHNQSDVQDTPDLEEDIHEEHVGQIQDLLLQSVGLSALRPSYQLVCVEHEQLDHPKNRSVSWTPLSAALEIQLIQIFFQSLAILCPVLDELGFYQWYQAPDRKHQHRPLTELILYAVIFAAFAHVDDEQLEQSPYSSVPEAQKAAFDHVRDLYNSLRDENAGAVELVQCSLILSHWSPYDSSREVNYFWADEALRHALLGGLHQSNQPHHRIIWWCGLQRNRALTLALKRPHKLKQYPPGRLPVISDFGSSSQVYNRTLKSPKIYAANLFISLCKLSVIMNEIVLLRHNNSRWDEWRAHSGSIDPGGPDLDRIAAIDRALVEWNTVYERTIQEFDEKKIPRRIRVSSHILWVMSHSTKASLYEQYIEISHGDSALRWLLNTVAVSKVKETSAAIALQVRRLRDDVELQDLPLNLSAWIILSVSVFLSQIKSQNHCRTLEVASLLEILLSVVSDMSDRFAGLQHTGSVIEGLARAMDRTVQDWDHHDSESLERELLAQGRRILKEGLAFGAVVQT